MNIGSYPNVAFVVLSAAVFLLAWEKVSQQQNV